MRSTAALLFVVVGCINAAGTATGGPVEKVLQMLSDLQRKLLSDGKALQKNYEEFVGWCEQRSSELGLEIKISTAEVDDFEAIIRKELSKQEALDTGIEELGSRVASNEASLKSVEGVRKREAEDFAAESKELMGAINALARAIGLLEREARKGGSSMLQFSGMASVAQALNAMVAASALSTLDAEALTSLLQSRHQSDDHDGEDGSVGAPEADAYEGKNGLVIETLNNLKEQAEEELGNLRKTEMTKIHNFEMEKATLQGDMELAEKELASTKKKKAESGERNAVAEGDMVVTKKELVSVSETLGDVHQDCVGRATDFQAEVKGRDEELRALRAAQKTIKEATGGKEEAESLLQVASAQRASGSVTKVHALHVMRSLARKYRSPALMQLASGLMAALQAHGEPGDDKFAKVKGMISDMIRKLEEKADAEATQKEYCDRELKATREKQSALKTDVKKLTTSLDKNVFSSAKLKEEVAELQRQLAAIAASQEDIDRLRSAEHDAFLESKVTLERGLKGIKMALKILSDYYSQNDDQGESGGAASGIIGLLEVVESDMSEGIAALVADEEAAQRDYDIETRDNAADKSAKELEVKTKSKEAAELDRDGSQMDADLTGMQSQLDATDSYFKSLDKQCGPTSESYEEKKERRDAEIAGLQEALGALGGSAASLLQRNSVRRILRGSRLQVSA